MKNRTNALLNLLKIVILSFASLSTYQLVSEESPFPCLPFPTCNSTQVVENPADIKIRLMHPKGTETKEDKIKTDAEDKPKGQVIDKKG